MAEELIIQYSVENNPSYTMNLALFTNVTNGIELRKLIIQGKIEAAFLNASMIIDPFHVAIAGHKALQLFQQGKMKTRTLHSEIVFNLSPSTNINESFKKFGILDNTSSVLVVIMTQENAEEKISEVGRFINGEQVSLTALSTISDQEKIKKIYGISEEELQCSSLPDGVVTRIATKDAA
ncbi:EKC/KEOPS complex subunit TPRKB [Stylophora pistillata]|uniref:EKC/KEOPS complex subunit TPRKB n=1 Tax=Stylophora pistillata TaxID=50429 RepID=A0A2B4RQ99_STYPI|nr:EKC/KEOPS complex subunit TPRKB [Stylophora pistillata]